MRKTLPCTCTFSQPSVFFPDYHSPTLNYSFEIKMTYNSFAWNGSGTNEYTFNLFFFSTPGCDLRYVPTLRFIEFLFSFHCVMWWNIIIFIAGCRYLIRSNINTILFCACCALICVCLCVWVCRFYSCIRYMQSHKWLCFEEMTTLLLLSGELLRIQMRLFLHTPFLVLLFSSQYLIFEAILYYKYQVIILKSSE